MIGGFCKELAAVFVSKWSVKGCYKPRNFLAGLVVPDFDSISHNPEVVGSNPAPATRRKDLVSQDTKSFFVCFSVFAADGRIGI